MAKKKLNTINYPFEVGSKAPEKEVVLSVRNLSISFKTDHGRVKAVRGVAFDLYKGETLCIVGESGSGKSVTNKTIMGILPKTARIDSGEVVYEGEDLTKVSEEEFHRIRGTKIGMIFQDPLSSLNPIMKIGKQITEVMIINGNRLKKIYNDLTNDKFIKYKNDKRLVVLAKQKKKDTIEDEKKAFKKDKDSVHKENIVKAKVSCKADVKNLKLVIKEDKKELKISAKAARKEVKRVKKELRKVHAEKRKAILKTKYKSFNAFYTEFIRERRRYVSEVRVSRKEAKKKALQIMAEVGIPDPERRFKQYPFEFSGGMRQRIVIAIALTANPDVLICDEPTTALDVTIQAQILELINRLKKNRHMSVIFITHDLGVVANMADRVAVMYAGKIVEYGTASDVFYSPAHPYTWALLSSIPDIDSKEKLVAIPGTPPNMVHPPKGDAFAIRSSYAMNIDFKKEPPMFELSSTHYAATWLLDEQAPEVEMPKIVSTRIESSLKKAGVKNG
ncbi:MAG: oligopeptide/dipeptide ABC transporter ATP-binding protein [Bacilli bacterium]|nr:oligopeptide/dipeptide ABC transporter ATP-binding protein [Bacilli bacterium]MDY6430356.1 oligopeptide/dipeptide ABC transporter ATP-binding protein [Bacilli bacterium]